MQRTVEREKKLPAFRLTLADLEILWPRLLAHFDNTDRVFSSISFELPTETLTFSSIEELKNYRNLKGQITNFNLWFNQGNRHIAVRNSNYIGTVPHVQATGDAEAWCAGAVDIMYTYANNNRLWYAPLYSMPIGTLLVILANLPTVAFGFGLKFDQAIAPFVWGWLAATLTLLILYLGKKKLFPPAVYVASEEPNFIKRHVAEISLVVAIASLIATIYGLVSKQS